MQQTQGVSLWTCSLGLILRSWPSGWVHGCVPQFCPWVVSLGSCSSIVTLGTCLFKHVPLCVPQVVSLSCVPWVAFLFAFSLESVALRVSLKVCSLLCRVFLVACPLDYVPLGILLIMYLGVSLYFVLQNVPFGKNYVKSVFTNFDHMDACGSSIGVP